MSSDQVHLEGIEEEHGTAEAVYEVRTLIEESESVDSDLERFLIERTEL